MRGANAKECVVVKVCAYGALMGALLMIVGAEPAAAADCKGASKHHVMACHGHRDRDHGRAYAQSRYDYRSASRVTESFFHDDGFRVAPQAPLPLQDYYPPLPRDERYYDDGALSGGVGYGASADGSGYGGGYGGVVTFANGGYGNPPPNGGGVNLPPGYGPDYRGRWQGPPVPTRGGLGIRTK
jgi:hypothetical protein